MYCLLLTFKYLRKEVCVVLVVEWRVSAQKDVRDDPDAPDVDRLAVGLLRQHLGGHIAWKKKKKKVELEVEGHEQMQNG